MQLRKIIFWFHLAVGLAAGLVIFVMCVTGALLTYERQIISWADTLRLAPGDGAVRLPLERLLAKARENQSNNIPATVVLKSDRFAPASVTFGRETTLFIDPYSAELLGEGSKRVREFFRTVTRLHRWLAVPEKNRQTGRAITGACNLAFLGLVISGLYLWCPRSWNWSTAKVGMLLNSRLNAKARDWNWHTVTGFWSAAFLFFVVLTGLIMSYAWANNLLYKLTGSELPPADPQGRADRSARTVPEVTRPALRDSRPKDSAQTMNWPVFDQSIASAQQRIPGWRNITLRLPASGKSPIVLTVDEGSGGRPDLRTQLTADSSSGAITKFEDFASYNRGRQLRFWARFVHTGEAGGWVGQTLAGLASIGGAVLVWTGFSLSWHRFFKKAFRSENGGIVHSAEDAYVKML